MASTEKAMLAARPGHGHRRNKSASVLKSIMHKRTTSDDGTSGSGTGASAQKMVPLARAVAPPVSKAPPSKPPSAASTRPQMDDKRSKSPGSLGTVFSKPKAKPGRPGKDKENTTPPNSANSAAIGAADMQPPPIWAEFHRPPQPWGEVTAATTQKVPLRDAAEVPSRADIVRDPSAGPPPSKPRGVDDLGPPALRQKPAAPAKERPRSTASFLDVISLSRPRNSESDPRPPLEATEANHGHRRQQHPQDTSKDAARKSGLTMAKRGARVMAAVAALNVKSIGTAPDLAATAPAKLDPKAVDDEFEAVLESRNIPQHQRAQMRTLKLDIKADFVRTHKVDTPTATAAPPSPTTSLPPKSKRSSRNVSSKSKGPAQDEQDGAAPQSAPSANSTKRSRPRSRTFTFTKGDSPTKKQKPDGGANDANLVKPNGLPKSPSSRSLSSASQKPPKGPPSAKSAEFVAYMKQVTKPQDVEVGKLHKLRLLLRNETVEWVDEFMRQGGMTQLVALLHRIMVVEWREEHEDTLLHEVLRCLKGLCTTDLALKGLCDIAPTLMPALLGMLFDEEHKGPSEFSTRELIISLLFAHLASAPPCELPARAASLLSYLKDPKEKESQAIPFILEMHQPRPYRVWCREITNVTKEVFWIFIHHLNVIPMPEPQPTSANADAQSYAATHFPLPRPPVPAAPYVGGVEWEATNYIATHLDLLNGLIASLPSAVERNALRAEFRVSGFEKLMSHLKSCNPKYYGAVHSAVKTWIGAAALDGWDVKHVRIGSTDVSGKSASTSNSPIKGPGKKSPQKAHNAPRIEAPNVGAGLGLDLDLQFEKRAKKEVAVSDDWI